MTPVLSETLTWLAQPVGRQMVTGDGAWAKTIHAYLDDTFGVRPVNCPECHDFEWLDGNRPGDEESEDCNRCQSSGYLRCECGKRDALFRNYDVLECLECALAGVAFADSSAKLLTVLTAETTGLLHDRIHPASGPLISATPLIEMPNGDKVVDLMAALKASLKPKATR